jgi:hypothetical protein
MLASSAGNQGGPLLPSTPGSILASAEDIGLLPSLSSIGHDISGVNLFVIPSNCSGLVNSQDSEPIQSDVTNYVQRQVVPV